jgi:nitrogenase subunit NifH
MEEIVKENVQETPEQQGDKVSKQFDANFKKLIALLGGDKNLKKVNVPNDEIGGIVEDLIKERREDFIKDFKEKAKDLLNRKLEFDKEVKKAEEQFKNTVIQMFKCLHGAHIFAGTRTGFVGILD